MNIITADWSEIMVRSMWQVLGNDKEIGLQFLNCHQKNKTVLNSVTIIFFFWKKKKKRRRRRRRRRRRKSKTIGEYAGVGDDTYDYIQWLWLGWRMAMTWRIALVVTMTLIVALVVTMVLMIVIKVAMTLMIVLVVTITLMIAIKVAMILMITDCGDDEYMKIAIKVASP